MSDDSGYPLDDPKHPVNANASEGLREALEHLVCVCGHRPVEHGDPAFFGTAICLALGCTCDRYQDTFDAGPSDPSRPERRG